MYQSFLQMAKIGADRLTERDTHREEEEEEEEKKEDDQWNSKICACT